MGVAVKRLRIGRRRAGAEQQSSPFELAIAPALVDDRWRVPDHFNFTRDVVEALATDPKRRALMFSGHDGIIEPRTFQLSEARRTGRRSSASAGSRRATGPSSS